MEIQVLVCGFITGVSGEGRNYGASIELCPVTVPDAEPGYFHEVLGVSVSQCSRELAEIIRDDLRGHISREGKGRRIVEVPDSFRSELETLQVLASQMAEERAKQIRGKKLCQIKKALQNTTKRERFETALEAIGGKAINGTINRIPVTLTAYFDGIGFAAHEFKAGTSLPKECFGNPRFETLEEALRFGFQPNRKLQTQ